MLTKQNSFRVLTILLANNQRNITNLPTSLLNKFKNKSFQSEFSFNSDCVSPEECFLLSNSESIHCSF